MKQKTLFTTLFLILGLGGFFLGTRFESLIKPKTETEKFQEISSQVLPESGFNLPISWGILPDKLTSLGVIDKSKFPAVDNMNGDIVINSKNSQDVVTMLWAIGLAQKSIVYDIGPMGTDYKKDAGSFASTGGWTLSKGRAMDYLNKYDLISLSSDQQNRVAEITKNIYRPCCDNSTWFPDCNHGMAALAAVEMMVKKDLPDEQIYKNMLKLNSFFFPDSYLTIALYFDKQGTPWDRVNAKEALGKDFSSATGAQRLQSIVGPLPGRTTNAGSC